MGFTKYTTQTDKAQARMNESIRAKEVRVLGPEGENFGVLSARDALDKARSLGLDLIEISPNANPPVCRITDYGKFKYEQKKKLTKNTKQHQVQIKEIRLRPKTGDHDIDFKVKQARGFLTERDKVKVNVLFRGREIAHADRGRQMILDIITKLEDIAKVEKMPTMEGKSMSAILTPR